MLPPETKIMPIKICENGQIQSLITIHNRKLDTFMRLVDLN